MENIDEFIKKLEDNKTTPNERRKFICSLTKNKFIYFLKKDFSTKKSIDIRADLFEEYISQTEHIISEFTIKELKNNLPKIKPEYITIKNLFIEHLIHMIHDTSEEINIKNIINFKHRVETGQITHEDIRTFLLKMKKEEFSLLITLDKQETSHTLESISMYDEKIDEMYEYQAEIIAEILEEYTEDEMVELIPFLNEASSRIRIMFFKCFNERKANEIFLTNAPKYSKDIFSYIATPTQNNEKDEMIVSILSNPKLYSLYDSHELHFFRTLISNKEIILDESSNIINTTEEELKQEGARYVANLRCRIKRTISKGLLKKMSSQKLYELLNEVNKGLQNIQEEEISVEEFIKLIEMPLDKAVLFLKNCTTLKEEQKQQTITNLYNNNEFNNINNNEACTKVISKYTKLVVSNNIKNNDYFDYLYQDILELTYNKSLFENMLKNYARNEFISISPLCMNIFFSQLIEKIKNELKLDIKKEFIIGKSLIFDQNKKILPISTYIENENKIVININSLAEIDENQKEKVEQTTSIIAMIESIFYELRHIYQIKKIKDIGSVKDLYFLIDNLIQNEMNKELEKDNNSSCNKIDAKLYSLVSTLSLLNVNRELKDKYWTAYSEDIINIAHRRTSSILKKNINQQKKTFLIDSFNQIFGGLKCQKLIDEYPMLAIVTEDGYILSEEQLTERYKSVKQSLNKTQDEKTYIKGEKILNFLIEYLNNI